jgi:outer membrane protein assembly factor BamB
MAVVAAGELTAFNAQTGAVVWTQKQVRANNNSPVAWQTEGGIRLLCNTSRDVACVDLKSGDVLWTVPGGGPSTAAVAEGYMVVLTSKDDVGLIAYRLSAAGAEKLWNIPGLTDRGASPIIHDDHVYAVAGRKAACVRLATGNIVWEGTEGRWDVCSPVLADGKLIAVLGGGRGIAMLEAAPGAYKLLASAKLSASGCASPAIADGRLYVRMRESVACFDLTRPAASAP